MNDVIVIDCNSPLPKSAYELKRWFAGILPGVECILCPVYQMSKERLLLGITLQELNGSYNLCELTPDQLRCLLP